MKLFGIAACAVVCGWLAAGALAADKVANPAYKLWAQYKVGTSVSHQTTTLTGGAAEGEAGKMPARQTTMKMSRKLVELTPETAVVEVTTVNSIGGREVTMPPRRQEIAAMVDADKADEAAAFAQKVEGEKPEVKKGEEEIKVLDKTLKCRWIQATTSKRDIKFYLSDQVPGGLVRMHARSQNMTSNMELTAYEVAK